MTTTAPVNLNSIEKIKAERNGLTVLDEIEAIAAEHGGWETIDSETRERLKWIGTFYRKPNPDSPVYVSLNEKVDKGAVLCIVEAMKLMNEIEADVSGIVTGILVEDGSPVEYGQPLFKIAV